MKYKNNKTCVICQKKYSYCPSCSKDYDKPDWYMLFDGDNCYKIYDICTSYRDNKISKKKAFELITKCDLADLENFNEGTKGQIKEMLSYAESNDDTDKKKSFK